MSLFKGCFTALITPFTKNLEIDYEGLNQLTNFQLENNISGIVATGTTGESPTLNWNEHIKVIEYIQNKCSNKNILIAGTGSNNTHEALDATSQCYEMGVEAVLLVDPYYNGPSSLEIRKEYIEPIAKHFLEIQIIPYIIPGRTGTQIYPQDIALLHEKYSNVNAVKEATGNIENAALIRDLCGKDFAILSGDDDKTYEFLTVEKVKGNGVISVISNIIPQYLTIFVESLLNGKNQKALDLNKKIRPLLELVTINTLEETPYGQVQCKARNPLPIKTLMRILGMPSGPCRSPLGKMTHLGIQNILEKVRFVYENAPEIFEPIEYFFEVNLQQRLHDDKLWRDLTYESY